jgi:hypothetical protein
VLNKAQEQIRFGLMPPEDADQAYVESDGSFDAIIVSLLTSLTWLDRERSPDKHRGK